MGEFNMTNLGNIKFFLEIEVLQRIDGIYISQIKYVIDVLKIFVMVESNLVHNTIVPSFKGFKDKNGVKMDAIFFKKIGNIWGNQLSILTCVLIEFRSCFLVI